MKYYMAEIAWIRKRDGGRETIPVGKYSTPVKFHGPDKKEVWSMVFDLANQSNRERKKRLQIARINFLFPDDAPSEWLCGGAVFDVLEGNRLVAVGVCLHETSKQD